MKTTKPYIILVTFLLSFIFLAATPVSAGTQDFTLDLTLDNPDIMHCSVYAGGNTLPIAMHVVPNYDAVITVNNGTGRSVDTFALKLQEFLNSNWQFGQPLGDLSANTGTWEGNMVTLNNVSEDILLMGDFGQGNPGGCDGPFAIAHIYPDANLPTAPSSNTYSAAQNSNSTTSVAPLVTPPSSPTLSTVLIDNMPLNPSKAITVKQSQQLVITGQAAPNATVVLTIHSTPKTVNLKTDANGDWNYSLTGLTPGNHFIEASVIDPSTGKTSPATKILAFKVISSFTASAKTKNSNTKTVLGVLALTLVLVGWVAVANLKNIPKAHLPKFLKF